MSTSTLSRRQFLQAAAVTPLAMTALSAFQTKKIPAGLELYSVRTELMKDLPGTVTAVAKMGYQVVEFYSPYYSWTTDQAKEVRKLLDGLGIVCRSTHNSASSFTPEGLQKAIELNQIIGSKYIVMASPPQITGLAGWKALADQLSAVTEKLRIFDMAAGYHNHGTEWPLVEGRRPMDVLAGGTPKDFVLQLDVGTCVQAGQDPVAWVKANPGRIRSMHLKDWAAGEGRGYAVAFGEGDVQWKPLLDAAESTGGVEYYLIEQEVAGSLGELAMVQKCLENYRKLRG
jgi:sugar phosphate isomerase/epimerase